MDILFIKSNNISLIIGFFKWYDFRNHACMNYKHNDRFGIYASHENEVKSLSQKLNYSVDDILVAIQEVGFNEEEIEEYIRDRNDRSL